MVRYKSADTTTKQLLPVLSQFFNSSKLPTSGIEVLDFQDQQVMAEVKKFLAKYHAESLDLMVNDFAVSSGPASNAADSVLPSSAGDAINALLDGRRRSILELQQEGARHAAQQGHAQQGPLQQRELDGAQGTVWLLGQPAGHTLGALEPERRWGWRLLQDPGNGSSGGLDPVEASPATVAVEDPLVDSQWHLTAARAAAAWAQTQGSPQLIVAVLDSGVDLTHPDLRDNLWVNKGEVPDNGVDDDGNGYIDDVYGYDFAGPCTGDWRAASPAAASPPPPAASGRRRLLSRRMQQTLNDLLGSLSPTGGGSGSGSTSGAATSYAGAELTAALAAQRLRPPSPPPSNSTGDAAAAAAGAADGKCGGDPDPSPEPQDTGRGTHAAGIIAAVRGNGIGGSGIAPNVKIMVLKVAGPDGTIWASNVIAALNYAGKMGAHVISCSFAPPAPNVNPTSRDVESARSETRLYERAVAPLSQKGVLLVAAAGEAAVDLDALRDVGMPNLPCTLDMPNVMCVAASTSSDSLWREVVNGQLAGTNYGRTTVDIAAPGNRALSTTKGGSYDVRTGSTAAAPLVAGAAALVLSVLGADTGNFFQALRAKSLLMETGDIFSSLAVVTSSRLNVGRAVEAATAAVGSANLLVPSAASAVSRSSVVVRGFAEDYYTAPPSMTNNPTTAGLVPFDRSVRGTVLARFSGFKYGGKPYLAVMRAQIHLAAAGVWGVRLSSSSQTSGRLAIRIGQRTLTWPDALNPIVVMAPAAGWYDFELQYLWPDVSAAAMPIELTFSTPAAPRTFGPLPDGALLAGSFTQPPPPPYAPEAALGGGYNLLWSPLSASVVASGLDPALLSGGSGNFGSGVSAGSPFLQQSFAFSTFVDDLGYLSRGSLQAALTPAAMAVASSANRTIAAMAAAPVAALGVALTHLRGGLAGQSFQLRVTCTFCSVHVGGLMVLEAVDPTSPGAQVMTRGSSCVSVAPNTTLLLEVRFATLNTSSSALSLQAAPCTLPGAAAAAAAPTFVQLTPPLIGSSAHWKRQAAVPGATLPRAQPAMRCDAWNLTAGVSLGAGRVMQLPQPNLMVPDYRFQVPQAALTAACSGGNYSALLCSGIAASWRMADYLPRLANATDRWLVRCWGYWAGGFKDGQLATRGATGVATAVYLANQRVFYSLSDPDSVTAVSNRVPLAPLGTALNGYRQVLALEWHGVTAGVRLSVVDGTTSTSPAAPTLLLDSITLPTGWMLAP